MLGMNEGFKPRFLRSFAQIGQVIKEAVKTYNSEVKSGGFPNHDEQY
jgi:3-methyl-2-oxobutanoate hydroxymethyltransferase